MWSLALLLAHAPKAETSLCHEARKFLIFPMPLDILLIKQALRFLKRLMFLRAPRKNRLIECLTGAETTSTHAYAWKEKVLRLSAYLLVVDSSSCL